MFQKKTPSYCRLDPNLDRPSRFVYSPACRNIFLVTCRRIFASLLAFFWLSAPLLACLPNSSMTPAEMDCCKKMAGNCDMGGGNHRCCDAAVNHSAPEAALLQSSLFALHLDLAAAPLTQPIVLAPQVLYGVFTPFVSQSPPSLALSAVLRI
jgi:hypothetical protein